MWTPEQREPSYEASSAYLRPGPTLGLGRFGNGDGDTKVVVGHLWHVAQHMG